MTTKLIMMNPTMVPRMNIWESDARLSQQGRRQYEHHTVQKPA